MVRKPIMTRSAITRLAAALTVIAMVLLSMGACSPFSTISSTNTDADTTSQSNTSTGSAVLFMPSDGITVSQRVPLNTWAKLTPSIVSALKTNGMKSANIKTFTSDSLDKQSHSVQDWVVDHTSDAKASAVETTLIIAPAVTANASLKQYGDYVTQPQSDNDNQDESEQANTDTTATGSDDSKQAESNQAEGDEKAEARLRSALQLAKQSGIHVILIANTIQGFTPNVFVRCSTPEQIGQLQANMLVSKLDLETASSSNPKAIEVLIPYSSALSDSDMDLGKQFAKEAFKGIWKVLQPYYAQGKVYSPSSMLTGDSAEDDWTEVAFNTDEDIQVSQVIEQRLPVKKTEEGWVCTRIDGIIAMNDVSATQVTEQLANLGYSGSAADINPSITISGILGNIVGNKDLKRQAVPDPAQFADDDTPSSSTTDRNNRWPIVTGFGAYVDNLPQLVNGKQWMTGLEDREALANDIAETVLHINRDESLENIDYISKGSVDGITGKVRIIHENLLAVSASNLKTTLIDTGYISMADAGL